MRWHQCIERGSFRGWLYGRGAHRVLFKTQIAWRDKFCMIDLGFDEEDSHITLTLAVPFLFTHFGVAWPRKWIPRGGKFGGDITVVKLSIHSGAFWWQFWRDDMGWSSDIPKWRDGNFNPVDFIFGRQKYSEDVLETVPVSLAMPEKTYTGTVKILRSKWKRPRGWWTLERARADIEFEGGVPFPGKGENSWDCGEDAAYSMTCLAASADEAVEQFRASVMRDRKRYGGHDWRPETAGAAQ